MLAAAAPVEPTLNNSLGQLTESLDNKCVCVCDKYFFKTKYKYRIFFGFQISPYTKY